MICKSTWKRRYYLRPQLLQGMGMAKIILDMGIIGMNKFLVDRGIDLIRTHPAPKAKPW